MNTISLFKLVNIPGLFELGFFLLCFGIGWMFYPIAKEAWIKAKHDYEAKKDG